MYHGHWGISRKHSLMLSLTVLVTRICNGWHLLCACYMHLGLPRWPSGQESACQSMQEPQEMRVRSLGQEDPRRRAWQPTPVFLPGESPWTEGPGGLESVGSQRVKRDLNNLACMHTPTVARLGLKPRSPIPHFCPQGTSGKQGGNSFVSPKLRFIHKHLCAWLYSEITERPGTQAPGESGGRDTDTRTASERGRVALSELPSAPR